MGLRYLSWTYDIIYEPITRNGRGRIPGIGREVTLSDFGRSTTRNDEHRDKTNESNHFFIKTTCLLFSYKSPFIEY